MTSAKHQTMYVPRIFNKQQQTIHRLRSYNFCVCGKAELYIHCILLKYQSFVFTSIFVVVIKDYTKYF